MTGLLPGGVDSLVAQLNRNPHCLVELKQSGYARLKGRHVEGCSFQRCVWDAATAAGLVPPTVRAFNLSDDAEFAAYVAAIRELRHA